MRMISSNASPTQVWKAKIRQFNQQRLAETVTHRSIGVQAAIIKKASSAPERQRFWKNITVRFDPTMKVKPQEAVSHCVVTHKVADLPQTVMLQPCGKTIEFAISYTENMNFMTIQTVRDIGWVSRLSFNSFIKGKFASLGTLTLPILVASIFTNQKRFIMVEFRIHNDAKLGNMVGYDYLSARYASYAITHNINWSLPKSVTVSRDI